MYRPSSYECCRLPITDYRIMLYPQFAGLLVETTEAIMSTRILDLEIVP